MKSINMKSKFIPAILIAVCTMAACRKDEPSPTSILVDTVEEKTEFDLWLDRNFVKPYNIRFEYRLPDRESNFSYWVTPPPVDKARDVATILKYATLDTMVEMMASDDPDYDPTTFTKLYFPKVIYVVGSWEIDFNGTIVLGSAESGLQINLLGAMYFDRATGGGVTGLMLHEFMHILDGRIPVPSDYFALSSSDYIGDQYTSADNTYLEKGFLNNYARSSVAEDIAVTGGALIGESAEWWESMLEAAGEAGREKLESKVSILRSWLSSSFGVDADKWHEILMRRTANLDNIDWDNFDD